MVIEIIAKILGVLAAILLLTVSLNDRARSDIPQSDCAIASASVENGFILTDPNRFDHARVTATFEEIFLVRTPAVDHV